jgi:hypothetical protein
MALPVPAASRADWVAVLGLGEPVPIPASPALPLSGFIFPFHCLLALGITRPQNCRQL